MESAIQVLRSLDGVRDPSGRVLTNSRDLEDLDGATAKEGRGSG
jgi:hypothetical protein